MQLPISIRIAALAVISIACARADVTLPAIISDHMVLRKSDKVPIWGIADPGEAVTVTLAERTITTKADADGKWMAALDLSESGPGPFDMVVTGKNTLTLSDVVAGEVWLASGQSNMERPLKNSSSANEEIAASANPLLREFKVEINASRMPTEELKGKWIKASPETSASFSAVGYYFSKNIQNELKVPVGIINSSWGGTPCEAWTSAEAIQTDSDLKPASERQWKAVDDYPSLRTTFIGNFGSWLKENKREDIPVVDASVFAGIGTSTEGWVPVQIPGPVSGPSLPEAGVIWLRKEINLPQKPNRLALTLPIDGFDSVYCNGILINTTTYTDHPIPSFIRSRGPYNIPASDLKEGKNILAIRFYQPVSPAKIFKKPTANSESLAGEWLAKAEYGFPPLDTAKRVAVPKAPGNLPEFRTVPSFLFNGMIKPLIPYAISGVIWYQGEDNIGRSYQYRTAFRLLINDWRKQWGRRDLPFYFCQLANIQAKTDKPMESGWAELREAQSMALALPHTGQAVTVDIGESGDIHPGNKRGVGDRLARIALAQDYGRSIPFSGPVYDGMKRHDGKIVLSFKHTDGGLVARPLPGTYAVKTDVNETAPLVRNSPGSELEGFAICGEDKKWVWADAKINGNTVIVSSDKVPAPVAVRYAWAENPTCNLYNGARLPASPFRTDDFPLSTLGKKL